MINKLECTCIEAYKTRKMRDPNCCACSCDHNDLVEQLAKANEDYKALFSAIESCQDELKKANERVRELECSVDKANEMLEEVRASGDLGLYMDNKLTAFLVGDSEQLRKEQE